MVDLRIEKVTANHRASLAVVGRVWKRGQSPARALLAVKYLVTFACAGSNTIPVRLGRGEVLIQMVTFACAGSDTIPVRLG